jgi:hypothetical protein
MPRERRPRHVHRRLVSDLYTQRQQCRFVSGMRAQFSVSACLLPSFATSTHIVVEDNSCDVAGAVCCTGRCGYAFVCVHMLNRRL